MKRMKITEKPFWRSIQDEDWSRLLVNKPILDHLSALEVVVFHFHPRPCPSSHSPSHLTPSVDVRQCGDRKLSVKLIVCNSIRLIEVSIMLGSVIASNRRHVFLFLAEPSASFCDWSVSTSVSIIIIPLLGLPLQNFLHTPRIKVCFQYQSFFRHIVLCLLFVFLFFFLSLSRAVVFLLCCCCLFSRIHSKFAPNLMNCF